jgi:hypothetical protein
MEDPGFRFTKKKLGEKEVLSRKHTQTQRIRVLDRIYRIPQITQIAQTVMVIA